MKASSISVSDHNALGLIMSSNLLRYSNKKEFTYEYYVHWPHYTLYKVFSALVSSFLFLIPLGSLLFLLAYK